MTRTEVLRDLLDNGRDLSTARLTQLAAELGLPLADVLLVGGHPVPGRLLPPDRDREVMREFAYRVTYCHHAQLASLREFLLALPDVDAASETRPARNRADTDPFPAVLQGLMANRGFGRKEFPFVGLSMSTIRGMLAGTWHKLSQLQAMAGPLAWRTADLAALAGEPLRPLAHGPLFCRHVGAVFLAAVPRTTEQLVHATHEADRLNRRVDRGGCQLMSTGIDGCPDA